LLLNRTAVVKKGGKVMSFSAVVVCGNGKGVAAIGKGKVRVCLWVAARCSTG
jgi:ribosomal protein S5